MVYESQKYFLEIKLHMESHLLEKIKIFFIGIFLLILSPFFTIAFLFRPKHADNAYWVTRIWVPFSNWIAGVKVRVLNEHRIMENQPCIYLGNHQSNYDVLIYGTIYPKNCVSIGKKSLAWVPVFGWLYYLSGHILIDRKKSKKAHDTLDLATESLVNKGISLWLFPEGTRSKGRGLLPFKKGAFHIAINSQMPIVPIVAAPYLEELKMAKRKAGKTILEVLEPISTKGMTLENLDELIYKTRVAFEQSIERLRQLQLKENLA